MAPEAAPTPASPHVDPSWQTDLAVLRSVCGERLPNTDALYQLTETESWLFYDRSWTYLAQAGDRWFAACVTDFIDRPDLPAATRHDGTPRVSRMEVTRLVEIGPEELPAFRTGTVAMLAHWDATPPSHRFWLVEADEDMEFGIYHGQPGPIPEPWAPDADAMWGPQFPE